MVIRGVMLAVALFVAGSRANAQVEITFPAGELTVHGDLHLGPAGRAGPIVLLFHQGGGDARGEYREIIPRLLQEGFSALAVDARGGGARFGGTHRGPPAGADFAYCAAVAEVDGALTAARARGFTGPVVLWGSSYTGALVMQVAARRSTEVSAVLAFSPAGGEPMEGCAAEAYGAWLARTGVPALTLRPGNEATLPHVAAQLERFRTAGLRTYVAQNGVHGASMLSPSRVQGDVRPHWDTVLAFVRTALVPHTHPPQDRQVVVEADGWRLIGDVRLPSASPAPLVVLLNKAAGDRHAYDRLATQLAERGVGSLRIDLRGHGESTNLGRFTPGTAAAVLENGERDVIAVQRYVRTLTGVDTARIAIVGASYSAEQMVLAARADRFARAYVALSPGSFSDDSFRAVDGSGARWLFIRSDNERFVRDWLDQKVRSFTTRGELWVSTAGAAHATDLLAADATLPERLADWLATQLRR